MTQPASVRADRGMVATSHPLAAGAGVAMLDAGGSAADAAVAAAAVLCVIDPRSTSIGGDAFALVWPAGASAPAALAGAGVSPAGLSVEALRTAGNERTPELGPWTVTVPGAVSAWERLLERYGRLGLERVLQPAIALAEHGFEVAPVIAREWAASAGRLAHDAEASRVFLKADGQPPAAGERMTNPELGAVLRQLAAGGADAYYRGPLAARIAAAVEAAGGPLREQDLAGWEGATWVTPLRRDYRGADVFQLPPPGQGIVVLEALGIYAGLVETGAGAAASAASDAAAAREHAAIEALKLAFDDAAAHVADPDHVAVPTERLLSEEHLAAHRAAIDPDAARAGGAAKRSDTVYIAAVDADGGACSLIQSLYEGFGSGIAVPGTGILLQNRGSNFSTADGHPNRMAGGKRPYHTIVPALLARDGAFLGCLGVVGGFMQPQGQMQILRHLLDDGLDPQAALDAPRARWWEGRRVALEPGFDAGVAAGLRARGHELTELGPLNGGGAQLILAQPDGTFAGASDKRKDGCALAQ
ncbi:gamma-glutamyltransferase family protein [Conexibacter sp. CPCC 206217]|uniref:gamma-glutamyltransferase family protein n=1 Tax=Conexibacter sp. CPCC 206217 TaxID=3064574 RepID=UPI002726B5C9|nr:gamma-glutamyltransferase family protein [Conexibacter sp. CPCC 206217]MDO8212524.1 gamma-glutamyltransferase family protein [Conexibacter sp. CPCC 206217]